MFSIKKKLIIIILFGIFVIATAALGLYLWQEYYKTSLTAAERRTLNELDNIVLVGDYSFPPLSYTDEEGQYNGYEADLVKALEMWLGIPIVYYQMIWSEALDTLSAGEITGITGMRFTSERALIYNYSEPYWQTSYSFVCTAGSDYETVLAADHPVVIVQKSSATYEYFLNNFYREDIEFIWIDYPAEAIAVLSKGEADLWFENYHVARHEVLNAGMIDLFVFNIIPESIGHYAFALGSDYAFLVPIINKYLLSMERDGILSELDNKWFGLTDLRPAPSPWRLTMPVAAYFLLTLFLLILFWNRFLQTRIDHKTEELRKSEKKLRASFEGAHDAIFITSKDGKMLDCNINTLDLFGYKSKNEFLALSYKELSPEKQPDSSRSDLLSHEIVRSVIDSGNLLKFEWVHLRKDGSTFQAEVALTTYQLDGQNLIQASISDITERKHIQNQLEYLSMHDQLTGLYNRAYFEEELKRLEESRYYPITLISADLDGLKLINDSLGHQTGDLLLVACAGILKESIRTSDLLARIGGDEFCIIMPNTDMETGESIAQRIRANISRYNKKHSDRLLGLSIGLATAENNDMMLNELFKQADDLMYRDKLYRSASVKNKVVQSLLAALAERDYVTEGHAQRLEENCLAIGEKINLSSRQLADLALLAKVHDLGKVGISDQILYKPASLSAEEWAIMKKHTEKGFRIARSSPDLSGVADLILKHHERWDGSGYPLGLSGEDIHIECRILALVDAYDAMTHDRPYAKAKSPEEAIIEIKNGAGSQFDPYLAEIFIAIIENK